LYIDNVALVATRTLFKESLKNTKTKANAFATKIKQLGLEVKLLKIEAIVYHRIRIESPIGGEMVMAGYIIKTS